MESGVQIERNRKMLVKQTPSRVPDSYDESYEFPPSLENPETSDQPNSQALQFSAGAAAHFYDTRYDICDDEACEEYEHRTMGFVNWRSNPCDSYFLYACTGFQKEAVDLNIAIYESHLDFIKFRERYAGRLSAKG
ncbi:hypothetical protein MTO96_040860, partial [Rhipicephalus appendiculatus]